MAFTDQGAYLDTSERVHIGGTGDPSVSLKVTGEVYVTSNITAYYSSDITLKDNVRPIESALFKIQQIRGVEFDWNEKSTKLQQEKGHDVGLIAQEVETVEKANGYAANENDCLFISKSMDGLNYGLKYERLVPVLINAIKELSAEVKALKAA